MAPTVTGPTVTAPMVIAPTGGPAVADPTYERGLS